jgi:hypothetical protein
MSAPDPRNATKVATKPVAMRKTLALASRLAFGLGVALIPAGALADDAPPPAAAAPPPAAQEAAPAPAASAPVAPAAASPDPTPVMAPTPAKGIKGIGGHIGIAVPLLMVDHPTKNFGDEKNIADPIGVTVKLNDQVAVDFEVIVATHINQGGKGTSLTVDPGIIYNAGPVAAGLRVKWDIGGPPNIGIIPLINRGLVDFGAATWFIEAAFPTTYVNKNVNFDVVLHTGLGF